MAPKLVGADWRQLPLVGFCIGGGLALLSVGSGFDAAAVNYGRLSCHFDQASPTLPGCRQLWGKDGTPRDAGRQARRGHDTSGCGR
jgi:carboxymethylenebutenolidase